MIEISLYIKNGKKKKELVLMHEERDTNLISMDSPSPIRIKVAQGNFGKVLLKEIPMSFGILQMIELVPSSEIEINFTTIKASVSLLYCDHGFVTVTTADTKVQLVAQTQMKTVYTEIGGEYVVKVMQKENEEFRLLNLSLPISGRHLKTLPPVREMIQLLTKVEPAIKMIKIFPSTPDFQAGIIGIEEELKKKRPDILKIELYTQMLILEMIQYTGISREYENYQEDLNPERKAIHLLAEGIILGIDAPWTINKLAASQNLNPNRLKILFKKHMGMPIAVFKITVRMQKAKQLLLETKLSIQEISSMVGYPNASQFATMFKRKMGCTPNQIRKTGQ